MNAKNQTVVFVFLFILLFVLFNGLGLLTTNYNWTLTRILIFAITVTGVVSAWKLLKRITFAHAFRKAGFGIPDWRVVGIAIVLSMLMLAFFPLYSFLTDVQLPLQSNWPWILVGMITGVGIAEETLFRGYVFNFLRETNSFWKAATLSMILFGAMHLLLLLWLPLPIAIAAILLAILAAYPTAYLFEKGNRTIWPSAILHTTALATNLFKIPAEVTLSLSLLWIVVVLIGSFLVFGAGRFVLGKQSHQLSQASSNVY